MAQRLRVSELGEHIILCSNCFKVKQYNQWFSIPDEDLQIVRRISCSYRLCPECAKIGRKKTSQQSLSAKASL